jgi:hypothetical protein
MSSVRAGCVCCACAVCVQRAGCWDGNAALMPVLPRGTPRAAAPMSQLLQLGLLATTWATTAEEPGPTTVPPAGPPGTDFFSVDVFTGGTPGIDSKGRSIPMPCYRIPSIVHVKGTQTLVAFAEARPGSSECKYVSASWSDSKAQLRQQQDQEASYAGYYLAMSRSTSGGRTWSNITYITEQADDCGHQPTAVYDDVRKRIVLQIRCGGRGASSTAAIAGIMADESGAPAAHPYQMLSTDAGLSWSERTPLWQQLPPTFQQVYPGPGIGLQLHSGAKTGRLLFCGWDVQIHSKTKDAESERDAVWYSDDGGATYTMANASASADFRGMDECQMAELKDGRIMIMLRHDNQFAPCSGGAPLPPPPPGIRRLARCKAVAYSSDFGASFGPVSYVPALESGSDESSVLGLDGTLFYSGAADHSSSGAASKKNGLSPTYGRKNFTIRASTDSGKTWPRSVQLCGLPVNGSCNPATSLASYSSLVSVPSKTDLGVLWEVETANHLWTGALRFTILPRTL